MIGTVEHIVVSLSQSGFKKILVMNSHGHHEGILHVAAGKIADRYWPELLASGELPAPLANRIVEACLAGGRQFCRMTRFNGHLDDWPLADYLYGLWRLGRKDD